MKTVKLPLFLLGCLISIYAFGQDENYKVTNLEVLNSGNLDYAPVPYRDGIMFTSTRRTGGAFSCPEKVANDNYSDLWFAQKAESGGFFDPVMLDKELKGKYHVGAATFNEEGTKMYFSRNNADGTNEKNVIDLKIYEADLKNGMWTNIKELNFNNENYATCHPALSADGQALYFSSNRPGGFGGMDIWVTEWNGLGWGMPENLGETVNSNGNEIFPFIEYNGRLVFASSGWGGYGGLDLFSVNKKDGAWVERTHMEAPLNSRWDDFGYSSEKGGATGYFTSNRKGGIGKDDLYGWEFLGEQPVLAAVCVIDANDKTRIIDADLFINSPIDFSENELKAGNLPANANLEKKVIEGEEYYVFKSKNIGEMKTPASKIEKTGSCDIEVPILPEKNYQISVAKYGYEPKTFDIKGKDMIAAPEYLIPINPVPKQQILTGLLYNKKSGEPLSFSSVQVLNKCTGEKSTFSTDHKGNFQMEIDCNCEYEMVGEKEDFKEGIKRLLDSEIDCEEELVSTEIPMEPNPAPAPVADTPSFTVGQVIQLDKLYYDFNEYYIRSDASIELDKVVALLRKYPSMELELSSHTDSRGSDSYNERLSSNRAKAAVEYIISKGISKNRVVAKGYGETQLVNQCANGVKCSDEEHQANRRTEIKVTAFKEEGVRIKD